MARDAAGLCHLYYSRWRLEEGFNAWVTHSEIAHAVAGQPWALSPRRHRFVGADPALGRTLHSQPQTILEHEGRFLFITPATVVTG